VSEADLPAAPSVAPAIPTLDLSTVDGHELVEALAASSCVFLVGHGVDPTDLDALLGTAREFYSLPDDQKRLVEWSGEPPWRGWQPIYEGGPSALLLERFELSLAPGGQVGSDGLPTPLDEWAATFDQWPEQPEGMRAAWSRMYAHLHGLAGRVAALIAQDLGVPAEDVEAWTTRQHANLVVNHYLAQHEAPAEGRIRQRSHTDIGGLTLLWTDDAPGGLEARLGPGGTWVPVQVPEGAWLLQAGDLLHLWSGGRIPANDHRVVNPPRVEGVAQVPRYSVAYFHHPDLSTWVAPVLDDAGAVGSAVGALDHIVLRQAVSGLADAAELPA
jgi:isopenicillin N synthase-like dioxygenase